MGSRGQRGDRQSNYYVGGVKMNTKGLFSHASDNWRTPKDIYDCFMSHGFIDCFKYEANYDEFKNSYRGGAIVYQSTL